ncbi:MAG: nucleotidyl transferase AbiEii/AbiGii toxin family protein [Thermoplasmata archaeon]|nr:nucleotidyl transferase AbiEii/AbiGii toxin family protein [Thermoplasmata archaeon]
MRIELTHDERMEILSTVTIWDRQQITQEVFRDIQRKCGIPARLVEITFWHTDTLAVLADEDWMVFKGGTCVQSFLPAGYQRASVDLDFNSTIGNPNSIKDEFNRLNQKIRDKGKCASIQGFGFGTFEFRGEDTRTGTLNFTRRMPSRFGELERSGDKSIQAKSIRVQINYKHSWLPALNPIRKVPGFFIFEHQKPLKQVRIMHSGIEDLIADKTLALSMVGPFGRERFKDVYDLAMLLEREFDPGLVMKKLELVGRRSNLEAEAFVKGAVETVSSFGSRSQEAGGFASMICRQGRGKVSNWENFCLAAAEKLKELLQ